MKLTLRVDQGEGPYEVTTNLWVMCQWERKFNKVTSNLTNGIGMNDLGYMAYEASKISGHSVPVSFDDFLKKSSVEVVADAPVNPTPAAAEGD